MVLAVSELHIDALLAVLIGAAFSMACLRGFEWLARELVTRSDARMIARASTHASTADTASADHRSA